MSQRQRSESTRQRDAELLGRIEPLKADHPAWGYRRIWAYLRYREGIVVGKNRVYRVLKENQLLACHARQLKAKRAPHRSKPRTTEPNRLWGIDMTKIHVESWGWLYLHVVKDWGSKKITGWSLSPTSRTDDWLEALQGALNAQFPEGVRESDSPLQLVSDNGCQPTSTRFMAACSVLGLQQIFTSYNNPKGNADTERVIRTLKEDLIWPRHWTSYQQLHDALAHWVTQYNTDYPHSAIHHLTPQQYEDQHHKPKPNQPTSTLSLKKR